MTEYYPVLVVLGVLIFIVIAFVIFEMKHSKGTCKYVPDYLLILGCRVKGDKAEQTLQMRIDAAAKYLKENENVVAISCGGIVHDDQTKSEAQVIKESLILSGIEEKRIILEDKSLTTVQNFINAKNIIESQNEGEKLIAFLSSDFHLFRASVIAKKCGVAAKSIAANSPKNLKLKNYLREFICFPGVLIGK